MENRIEKRKAFINFDDAKQVETFPEIEERWFNLKLDNTGKLSLVINGEVVKALVDSGSEITTITKDAAEKVGIWENAGEERKIVLISWGNTSRNCYRSSGFVKVEFGEKTIEMNMRIINEPIAGYEILIGMDFLVQYSVIQTFESPNLSTVYFPDDSIFHKQIETIKQDTYTYHTTCRSTMFNGKTWQGGNVKIDTGARYIYGRIKDFENIENLD